MAVKSITKDYDDQSIVSLKGADRVRKRPGVIFGSDGLEGCEHSADPTPEFPVPRSPRTLLHGGHTLRTSVTDQQTQAEVNKRTAPPKAHCDMAKIWGFAYSF